MRRRGLHADVAVEELAWIFVVAFLFILLHPIFMMVMRSRDFTDYAFEFGD
jgi:hypothetical protein